MGQTQLQKGLLGETIEYLGRAISKAFTITSPCFTRSPPHAPPLYYLLHATLPPPLPKPSQLSYFQYLPVSSCFFHSDLVDDDSLINSGSVLILTEIVNFGNGVIGSGEESILPVQTLISVLDAYHNLFGFPW